MLKSLENAFDRIEKTLAQKAGILATVALPLVLPAGCVAPQNAEMAPHTAEAAKVSQEARENLGRVLVEYGGISQTLRNQCLDIVNRKCADEAIRECKGKYEIVKDKAGKDTYPAQIVYTDKTAQCLEAESTCQSIEAGRIQAYFNKAQVTSSTYTY